MLPDNLTSLRAAVLRYQKRLEEEAHAAAQCCKAWQSEHGDVNPQTTAYLSGKSAGFNEAHLLLTAHLRGDFDGRGKPT